MAPREQVFEAFTQPEALMRWFGPKGLCVPVVTMDVRVGGRYRLEMHGDQGIYVLTGEYREVRPPEKLVLTWIWAQGEIKEIETLVSITLSARGDNTELTLEHAGLPSFQSRDSHRGGWESSFDCLADMLAGRPKAPVVSARVNMSQ